MKISGYIGGWWVRINIGGDIISFYLRSRRGGGTCYLPSRETRASRMAFETYCCRNEGCRTNPGWRRPAWRTPLCWIDCKLQQNDQVVKFLFENLTKIIRIIGGNSNSNFENENLSVHTSLLKSMTMKFRKKCNWYCF